MDKSLIFLWVYPMVLVAMEHDTFVDDDRIEHVDHIDLAQQCSVGHTLLTHIHARIHQSKLATVQPAEGRHES